MDGRAITADAAGTWTLGDLTVNRIGFGAMRLTRNADGTPGSRERAGAVLRRALDLGVNHIGTAAFYSSRGQRGRRGAAAGPGGDRRLDG